ncbi:DASH family cryptochrome [Janthinobacterium sp. RB2R34]|uniref:DASH family cryptochrome n=1 Tax=Janthinobacterium sp. RB2R34 TaxID=3424193 RepID=UPI003F286FB1
MSAAPGPNTHIYWFRNDLRVEDNPALIEACRQAQHLLLVYCHGNTATPAEPWHVPRCASHRQQFLAASLADLTQQLQSCGSQLLELQGDPVQLLPALAEAVGATTVHCEEVAAPEEQQQVAALRASGLHVSTVWQSTLLDPASLPFAPHDLPDVFTTFRQLVERAQVLPPAPLPRPAQLPALPPQFARLAETWPVPPAFRADPAVQLHALGRSSFPYYLPAFSGGASAAAGHLQRYFGTQLAHAYKLTRNGLSGTDYSTKFSPWLACGAMSARQAHAALKDFEAAHGASDSSYWIWFELLWRDYFRLLHLKYGVRLYRAQGLTSLPRPPHDARRFEAWCQAGTGEPLVDAAMAELRATGYLSNRLRQVVASYLIHDLHCDWRAGAAWFEAQLIDYDVYSNQGNWLYIAGRGTDPRNGRRFNIQKQVHDHDRDGAYRQLWKQPHEQVRQA